MLMQVLSMTPDQIAGLDAQQQASIMQLVRSLWWASWLELMARDNNSCHSLLQVPDKDEGKGTLRCKIPWAYTSGAAMEGNGMPIVRGALGTERVDRDLCISPLFTHDGAVAIAIAVAPIYPHLQSPRRSHPSRSARFGRVKR